MAEDGWQPDPNLPVDPVLQSKFRKFKTEDGQTWGAKAIAMIQAHNDARNAEAAAQNVKDQFVSNLQATRANLVKMVKQDPPSMQLALQLADHTTQGLAASSGVDDADTHAGNVALHMRQEIAHTAVQAMASTSGKGAHAMLDQLNGVIPDSDIANLRTYTDNMTAIRRSDAQVQQMQQQAAAQRFSGEVAMAHLGNLTGPGGELQFPPKWGEGMMSDQGMLNPHKASLWGAFDRLRRGGDMPNSDPAVISDFLDRASLSVAHPDHPTVPDLIDQVGRGLSVPDAQFLGSLVGPKGPQQRDHVQALNDILDTASGELGNSRAMGRFTNWALPTYQRAAAGGSAPGDITAALLAPERLAQFAPTGDDIVAPAVGSPENRPPLGALFGLAMHRETTPYDKAPKEPWTPGVGFSNIADIPAAMWRGAKGGWQANSRTPEEVDKAAYENPLPVIDKAAQPPSAPRETMASLGVDTNPDDQLP